MVEVTVQPWLKNVQPHSSPIGPYYGDLVLEKKRILNYKFCLFVKMQSQPQIENYTS